ncbi:MAG: hypothetical protein ABGX04_03055 [Myxococcales bacterium]|nr:hypothetical protein [Myxococcales bacterium]
MDEGDVDAAVLTDNWAAENSLGSPCVIPRHAEPGKLFRWAWGRSDDDRRQARIPGRVLRIHFDDGAPPVCGATIVVGLALSIWEDPNGNP